MLQSAKNKATMSILDKLKQKGMPQAMSPMPTPEGQPEFQESPDYNDLDAMGSAIQAPGLKPQDLVRKKKTAASADEANG